MSAIFKKILLGFLRGVYRFVAPLFHFREVAVLAYHSISDSTVLTAVSPAVFERHLRYFISHGYKFVSLLAVVDWSRGKGELPEKTIALTFDDGYADFETTALPILEKFHASATIFVVGDETKSRQALQNNIPLLSKEALARMGAHPLVEIGYHSKTHANLAKLSGQNLVTEIAPIFPSQFFAYPGGNHSKESAEILRSQGYRAAFTIRPTLVHKGDDVFLLPRSVILQNMPLWQVATRANKTADWYRISKDFIHR